MRKKKVLVAMSGGVDSSAAAALLVQQGYDCDGAMLKLAPNEDSRCCSADDAEDARQAATRLGMRFYVFNETDRFRRCVMDRFTAEYAAAQAYGEEALKNLSCRELVTFHDGFSYFARAFRLTIAAAMEIEEGSEPSAKEIESVIRLVEDENIPAVFCEENGERQTAETVAKQTGTGLFALTMGMDGGAAGCTDAIYHNIDIIREALS